MESKVLGKHKLVEHLYGWSLRHGRWAIGGGSWFFMVLDNEELKVDRLESLPPTNPGHKSCDCQKVLPGEGLSE